MKHLLPMLCVLLVACVATGATIDYFPFVIPSNDGNGTWVGQGFGQLLPNEPSLGDTATADVDVKFVTTLIGIVPTKQIVSHRSTVDFWKREGTSGYFVRSDIRFDEVVAVFGITIHETVHHHTATTEHPVVIEWSRLHRRGVMTLMGISLGPALTPTIDVHITASLTDPTQQTKENFK